MFQVLVLTECGDPGLAVILSIIQNFLLLFQIIVPIILILFATISVIRLVINPDDKKGKKRIVNQFLAALIIIFLPFTVNLFLSMVGEYATTSTDKEGIETYALVSCWNDAKEIKKEIDASDDDYASIPPKKNQTKYTPGDPGEYEKNTKEDEEDDGVPSGPLSDSAAKGYKVVNYAKKFIGTPYVWGGVSLTKGADCSGFVQSVYAHFGYNISRVTGTQINDGKPVANISQARAGDLIFYAPINNIGHVAMFMGDGTKIIHSSGMVNGIGISPTGKYRTIIGIRRIIPD